MDMPYEDGDYVVFPEEALKYLPEKWQDHIHSLKEEGKAVLDIADKDLQNLLRLVHAFPSTVTLRYILSRLRSLSFEPSLDWVLENDTLILAFVTTYARLVEGGIASGISRGKLPNHLRTVHDEVMELRHKRYAHNAGHNSLGGSLDVQFDSQKFEVGIKYMIGFQVGGALEWDPLVDAIEELMFDRLEKQLHRLGKKTGRKWQLKKQSAEESGEWFFPKNPSSKKPPQGL
ncbi:hypothetical protein [Thalassospira australica]|uniref:hypothetical protein n=1 Tax=Thalassospira australica TaxID=1528106 RepID=UPI00384A9096